MSDNRVTPNPKSELLKKAVVAGSGLCIPPGTVIPHGYGAVVLLVPLDSLCGMNPREVQQDLGMPWSDGTSGPGLWFDELR